MATRVLVIADWSIDPQAVIDACERRNREHASAFAVIVPAWLHGIDWAGDPNASVPCAHRQLLNITALAARRGRAFDKAVVGDPEPVTAMCDALAEWPADAIVICSEPSRLGVAHPFDLNHRARRVSGLPVERVVVRPATASNGGLRARRAGHCEVQPA